MDYVMNKINDGDYVIVPESLAIGKVFKVLEEGNLSIDGYEKGYLFIPNGSGIKVHTHTMDVERYELISGILSVDGSITNINICDINKSHNIDIVSEDTVIRTYKVSKKYMEDNNLSIDNCFR